MSKYRQAATVDKNQNDIVKELTVKGYSVDLDHDDIIAGSGGLNYWIEIKEKSPFGKNGKLLKGKIKDSQYKILFSWRGQYNICWNVEQIKAVACGGADVGLSCEDFQLNYRELLTESELNRLRWEGIIIDDHTPDAFERWKKDLNV